MKQKHPLLNVFNEVLKVSTYKNNLVLAILNIHQLIIAVLTSNLVPKYVENVSFLGYLDWYCNLVSFYSLTSTEFLASCRMTYSNFKLIFHGLSVTGNVIQERMDIHSPLKCSLFTFSTATSHNKFSKVSGNCLKIAPSKQR